jgi:mannobiose 2-epimerase
MINSRTLRKQFSTELIENILAYWKSKPLDLKNGGFFGAITNDNQIINAVERSAVLCGRLLWTFSTAYTMEKSGDYLMVASWFYDYLSAYFWDTKYEGIYWSLNDDGTPHNDRKHTYAQAFAIYGLCVYYRITQEKRSLLLAKRLFALIDEYTHDAVHGGNIECRARDWSELEDMRLSELDVNSSKSMNTLLHLMEAYTQLVQLWPDPTLQERLQELIRLFLNTIVDSEKAHQKLFFDNEWHSMIGNISYGHDIEASWLILEAAEASKNEELIERAKELAVKMAQKVYDEAFNKDGSILYELTESGKQVQERHWWAHAEAVVGFYNAYQISDKPHFRDAAEQVWQYIQDHFVDTENGDWFKVLDPDGTPQPNRFKVGPWECPYHHARMCMEMMNRLGG